MLNRYNTFISKATSTGRYVLIPQADHKSIIDNDSSSDNNYNERGASLIEEVHDFRINASSNTGSGRVIINVYICGINPSDPSDRLECMLFSGLVIDSGEGYYNEKTISILPDQTLEYEIVNYEPANYSYSIQASASTIEVKSHPKDSYYTLQVVPLQEGATVEMKYADISSTIGSIEVPSGYYATYTVEASHYISAWKERMFSTEQCGENETYNQITRTKTRTVNLTPLDYFKITTNVDNATITITADNPDHVKTKDGYIQQGDEIWIKNGDTVSYTVSAPHYSTVTISNYQPGGNMVKYVPLSLETHTLTVLPDPEDAIVELKASGYTQIENTNSITVPYGTEVQWKVSKFGYITQTGTYTILDDDVVLDDIFLELEPNAILISEDRPNVTAYQYEIERNGIYEVSLVGAGGGGSSLYKHYKYYWGNGHALYVMMKDLCYASSGGSGSAETATYIFTRGDVLHYIVGTAGTTVNTEDGDKVYSTGQNGNDTILSVERNGETTEYIRCKGGEGAISTWQSQFTHSNKFGNGGEIETTYNPMEISFQKNGNNGVSNENEATNIEVVGAESIYDRIEEYGKSGNTGVAGSEPYQSSSNGGYFRLKYIGPAS